MSIKVIHLFLLLGFVFSIASPSNILCYLPNPSKSHVLLALPICEELARRGHQITTITNHKHGLGGANYTEIVVPIKEWEGELLQKMISGNMSFTDMFGSIRSFIDKNVETLKSHQVQSLLKENSFELVLFLNTFNNFNFGIADHFKAPYAVLNPMGLTFGSMDLMGTQSFISTVPTKMPGYPPNMSFYQRVVSVGISLIAMAMTKYVDMEEERLYNEFWPSNKYRSFSEMKKNASALFYNGHWSESKAIRPNLPNEVEIGGIQINSNPKPLEVDIQTFLDAATDGVIVWTFGSNLPISKIDSDKLEVMFKVLGKLKQRVIMRWDLDDNSILPSNFMGRKWLAQDSILAHKNVKLFITHGGLGGTMEAMYHEVPILGFPFFGDQDTNMAKFVNIGWARSLKIYNVTEENFSEALNDLLTNKSYKEKVKQLSSAYKDRPQKPLEAAVFWMEYILKYHGAPHLVYPGRHLNFFQIYSLDIIGFLFVILSLVCYLFFATFRCLFRKVVGKGKAKDKRKEKMH